MENIVLFVGYSNSGKTTVLSQVVRKLANKGLRVGVIKHHHSHDLEVSSKQKDTDIYKEQGATKVLLVRDKELRTAMLDFKDSELDLLVGEGFKNEDYPKVEVHRKEVERIKRIDDNYILLISNTIIDENIPTFKHEEIDEIADFVWSKVKEMKHPW